MNRGNCCSDNSEIKISDHSLKPVANSDCSCGCNEDKVVMEYTSKGTEPSKTEEEIHICIDGLKILVTDRTKNIVEVAKENGIKIPAPCFNAERKRGCCNACVVDINGRQEFACGTRPKHNMNIKVQRDDLVSLRKERLIAYKEGIRNGTLNKCCR